MNFGAIKIWPHEVPRVVSMETAVYHDVLSFTLVHIYYSVGGIACLQLQGLKIMTADFSEMSENCLPHYMRSHPRRLRGG
jgi:hypothetical protein